MSSREESSGRSAAGKARWLVVSLAFVVIAAAVLIVWLARSSGGDGVAGRPVPEPAVDPFRAGAAGSSPRPGELVITLSAERLENAHLKIETAEIKSGAAAGDAGLRTTGTVESNAYKEVPVFPLVGGIVKQVNAELGDRVQKGRVLATIFSSELAEAQATYLSMQAEAERHHEHYRRTADLVEIGAASREEFERATAESKTEQAKLNSMRERLLLLGMSAKQVDDLRSADQIKSLLIVEAPVAGTVLTRSVNPGEVLTTGKEMFRVADLSTVWVIGQVYENDFAALRVGVRATITAPGYPDRHFLGRVSYIDPRVDPATRTAQVRVEVGNPGQALKLGMFVDVHFGEVAESNPASEAVFVPGAAVQMIGPNKVVYIVGDKPGTFVQRQVATGPERDGMVMVRTGVGAGERVVAEGSFLLRAESLRLNPEQNTAISSALPNASGGQAAASEAIRQGRSRETRHDVKIQTARVSINANGYQPATIELKRGIPARVTFLREIEATCGTDVVIADFGIKKELPFKQPVVVEFTPDKAGEYGFTCGMNMLRGKIIVR